MKGSAFNNLYYPLVFQCLGRAQDIGDIGGVFDPWIPAPGLHTQYGYASLGGGNEAHMHRLQKCLKSGRRYLIVPRRVFRVVPG